MLAKKKLNGSMQKKEKKKKCGFKRNITDRLDDDEQRFNVTAEAAQMMVNH